MTTYLAVTRGLKGPSFAIYHDELPPDFTAAEKAGLCFSRPLSEEDSKLPLGELRRRWVEAKQPLPVATSPAPERIAGTWITLGALKQLLAWGLLCQGIVKSGEAFEVLMREDGVWIIPEKKAS